MRQASEEQQKAVTTQADLKAELNSCRCSAHVQQVDGWMSSA